MTRHVKVALFAAACLGASAAAWAEPKLYHLSKVPKFRVGDRARSKYTETQTRTVTLTGGAIGEKKTEREEGRSINEVLEVDAAGKIQAFRVTIVSEKVTEAVSLPKPRASKKDTALEKIHFVARRKGSKLYPDPTSVVGEKAGKLKASEISVLREHLEGDVKFPGWAELQAGLMPAQPVPVGHAWEPSRQAMDRFAEESEKAKKMGGKLLGAKFELVSVTDGVPLVKGVLRVEAIVAGKREAMTANLTAKIDTESGLWLEEVMSMATSIKRDGLTFDMTSQGETRRVFTRGSGKASALPAKRFDLGWKPPGKDTNSYKDLREGFSLAVPEGFAARDQAKGRSVIAELVNKQGLVITVTSEHLGRLADFKELLPAFMRATKRTVPDYEVARQEQLALPGNVPAVLLVGKAYEGKVVIYTVMALDGPRLLSVSTAAPAGNQAFRDQMRKVARSLRVFERDLTKAPKAPKAP